MFFATVRRGVYDIILTTCAIAIAAVVVIASLPRPLLNIFHNNYHYYYRQRHRRVSYSPRSIHSSSISP